MISADSCSACSSATRRSPPGASLDWHDAPQRQLVVTLTGTLEFVTRDGERFRLAPGDVLLAEDTAGGGHRWRLVDDQPLATPLRAAAPGRATIDMISGRRSPCSARRLPCHGER